MAQELGITPGHVKALLELRPELPRSMGALAETLRCDASNATWLVDRLEERGLVERRPLPGDRRVKTVVLTDHGVHTREHLIERMLEPPEDLLKLDRAQPRGDARRARAASRARAAVRYARRARRGEPMKIVVDFDLCESNAVCMGIAPEVFEVRDDDFLYVLNEHPDESMRPKMEEAVRRCPKQAISIEG